MGPEAPAADHPRRGSFLSADAPPARDSVRRLRVAVVGAGVSGLTAARLLARAHDVTLFEAEDRLGGHAHTHDVTVGGQALRLDTGFLVYNEATYPRFVAMLRELGVASVASDMALSVRCRRCRLEYAMRGPRALFAQKRNLLRPAFYGLFLDLGRFFREAKAWLDAFEAPPAARPSPAPPSDVCVGEFLERGGYGPEFVRHWLLPTASALWSAPFGDVNAYSARMLFAFFRNHLFLQRRQLSWRTVAGGSRSYVDAIARELGDRVRLGSPVARVERSGDGVTVVARGASPERFDAVVMACHADEARRLLVDADAPEQAALERFRYASHRVVLHTDRAFLPRATAAWAAWNSDLEDCRDLAAPASLTYYLNRLQGLATPTTFCVTLNPRTEPAGILRELRYAHPILTADALGAQRALGDVQGRRGTFFAGAHLGHGFHEDGTASGVEVARRLGVVA